MDKEKIDTILREQGILYAGTRKKYMGKIAFDESRKCALHGANTFGYYLRPNGTWIVFVTDSERGLELVTYHCDSEEKAKEQIYQMTDACYYNAIIEDIAKTRDKQLPVIISYLLQEYNIPKEQAEESVLTLSQSKYLTAEFLYFIKYKSFYPEKYAVEVAGYTAEQL